MLQGIRGNVVQFLDDGILKSKVKVEQRETRVVCLFSSTEEAEILPFFFFRQIERKQITGGAPNDSDEYFPADRWKICF